MIRVVRLTCRKINPKLDSLQEVITRLLNFTFSGLGVDYSVSITQGNRENGKTYYIWSIGGISKGRVWTKKELYESLSKEMNNLGFKSKDDFEIEELVSSTELFEESTELLNKTLNEITSEIDEEDSEDYKNKSDYELSDEIQDLIYEGQVNELQRLLKIDKNFFDKLDSLSPRTYQLEAIEKSVKNLVERQKKYGVGKGLLVLPTGFGKTFIAAQISDKLKQLYKKNKPFRVLFLAHKNDIVAQTATIMKNNIKGPFTNFYGYEKVGMLIGGKKNYHKAINNIFTKEPNDVIIANINTLSRMLIEFPKDYFDIIISDECHRSIGVTYRKCINYFNYKYLLGITATPSRTGKKNGLTTDSLFNFYENNIIYQKELKDAITENILATPLYFIRIKDSDLSELEFNIKRQILYKTNYNGYIKSEKKYLENFDIFDKDVDYLYENNKKTVVFCENIDIAEEVYHKINNKNYPTIRMFFRPDRFNKDGKQISKKVGESKITPDRFMYLINKFKQIKRGFLVVVDLFTEGTDIPEIDAMMLLRPTSSERIYFQILGRGLRKTEEKTSCLIFDYNFETIRLDLLKKKIHLFDSIKNSINIPQYIEQYKLTSRYVDILKKIIDDFEGDKKEQNRFKSKLKSIYFRNIVIPRVASDMFKIITDKQLSNKEKIGKFKDYKCRITGWGKNKNLFEEKTESESLIYFTKFLEVTTIDDVEKFLLDSEINIDNKIIAKIPTEIRNSKHLTNEEREKLKEFLDKNSHIGTNYTLEYRNIGGVDRVYVSYSSKGLTVSYPLFDFKKVMNTK